MSADESPIGLGVNVFTAPGKTVVGERPKPFGPPPGWDPITSTLIYGEYDAVLVNPLTTVLEANALADWVALHHRNLTTIYITHGHFDHFFGLSVLLERFPDAKAIATPKSVELINNTDPELARFAQGLFPGQFPAKITAPQPYDADTFTLEGHELRIIEQGRTDTIDSTSLHVPSIDLVVGGDVLYNQCHMFVGDTTPQSRENWIAALDRLAALEPKIAVAGHKKTGAPDTPDAIEGSKNYLRDFGRLQDSTSSEQELYDEMTKLYPDWVSHHPTYDGPQGTSPAPLTHNRAVREMRDGAIPHTRSPLVLLHGGLIADQALAVADTTATSARIFRVGPIVRQRDSAHETLAVTRLILRLPDNSRYSTLAYSSALACQR